MVCLLDIIGTAIVRAICFERKDGVVLKSICFKVKEIENLNKSDGSEKLRLERSVSFKNWESEESNLETSDIFYNGKENLSSISLNRVPDEPIQIINPTILFP